MSRRFESYRQVMIRRLSVYKHWDLVLRAVLEKQVEKERAMVGMEVQLKAQLEVR